MSQPFDLKPALEFLRGLRNHNNRAWFEGHRVEYEEARRQFEAFVDRLIVDLGDVEALGGLRAKDCVMRIYRDTRFSMDKSPYRTNMGAHIVRGGRKSARLGYYLHMAPEGASIIAGGLYMPSPPQLAKFRAAIGGGATRLTAIVRAPQFKRYFRTLEGEKVKTAPRGYPRDHPEIELLRFKQVIVVHHLSDYALVSRTLPVHVGKVFAVMKPFLDYLNAVIQV